MKEDPGIEMTIQNIDRRGKSDEHEAFKDRAKYSNNYRMSYGAGARSVNLD